MDTNGMIGEMLETGQSSVKKASKQTVSDFAGSVKGQIAGSQASTSQNDQGTNEAVAAQRQQMSDDQAKQFLKDLYGPTKPKTPSTKSVSDATKVANPVSNALGIPDINNQEKSPEELAKITALRNQLHSNYYQNLLNAAKAKDEPVTQKLEREEQEAEFEEIEKQNKKPAPVNPTVKQGTAESVVGVSG